MVIGVADNDRRCLAAVYDDLGYALLHGCHPIQIEDIRAKVLEHLKAVGADPDPSKTVPYA